MLKFVSVYMLPDSASHHRVKHVAFVMPIDTFTPTTVCKITAIITRTCKTCMLDLLPFDHVKQNIETLVIIVADVTNVCLAKGIMLTELKRALVHPPLKKLSLCKDTLSNYRPVSNLSQLLKVTE